MLGQSGCIHQAEAPNTVKSTFDISNIPEDKWIAYAGRELYT